jgi:long-subunit acyl-CoA synthetase (AMP-forming)
MKGIFDRIAVHAAATPGAVAIADDCGELDYRCLAMEIARAVPCLRGRRIGLLADNGRHWAVADLAIAARGALCCPLPGFFSEAQIAHLIRDADLDLIVTDQPMRLQGVAVGSTIRRLDIAGRELWLLARPAAGGAAIPGGTAKVTYTSGTTGTPKGVCLTGAAIEQAAVRLCEAAGAAAADRALSLLPLATLLPNIGGLYAPLHAGARAELPALETCGLAGSSGLRVEGFARAIRRYRPSTLILVPELLKALTAAVAAGLVEPAGLRFIAVGGAPVSPALMSQALALGLPVYQGYGLSEAASVVALELPGARRLGSVGRPLPRRGVRIAADGEVLVAAPGFLGYVGAPHVGAGHWPTGDLGRLDAHGYLYIDGRKRSAYATGFGRNLAPEWVEGELTAHRNIAQAAVFGAGRPFNGAVIVPGRGASAAAVADAIAGVNARLPDYARVARWLVAHEPFTPHNGLAGPSGAMRRAAVLEHYRDAIDQLYAGDPHHVAV